MGSRDGLRVEGCSPHVAASATEVIAALSAGRFNLIKILTSSYMPA
jgi:hypothetical protein